MQRAARQGLITLMKLDTMDRFRALGRYTEANAPQLGTPIGSVIVGADRLREYTTARDPRALFEPSERWTYPVTVGPRVRSSMTMERTEGTWDIRAYDEINAAALESVLLLENPGARRYLVDVLLLGGYTFMARDEGSVIMLTPMADYRNIEARRGVEVDARQLFTRLAGIARQAGEPPASPPQRP